MNANLSCDVTIFVKEAQNAEFSLRTSSQDFQDFESLYLWNRNRYQQMVESFLFGFQQSFILANKKNYQKF